MPKALYPVLACSFLCLCYFLFHGSSWTSYPRFVLSKEILRLSLRTSSTKEKTLSFSGMKTVTSSDWIPAVAGIQSYREVFEVSAFIVNQVAVSKTSRYNPFALGCSRITRSDIAYNNFGSKQQHTFYICSKTRKWRSGGQWSPASDECNERNA